MHLSTALVGTIASKPQLGIDHHGRRRCYVKIRQTVWDNATSTPAETTYTDMIVTSRTAARFAQHFRPGDGIIAQGEPKTSHSGTRYFLAHRVAADPQQSPDSKTRTPLTAPSRTTTPTQAEPGLRGQPDLTP